MSNDVVQGPQFLGGEWMRQHFQRMEALEQGAKARVAARRQAMRATVDAQLHAQLGSMQKRLEVPLPCSADMTWFVRETGRLHGTEFRRIITAVEFHVDDPFGSGSWPTGTTVFTIDLSGLDDHEAERLLGRFTGFVVRKFA